MESLFSNLALKIKPYIAGEQPRDKRYIKLNTNENPFPPSNRVKMAIEDFDYCKLKLYPDPEAIKLRKAIAEVEGVSLENVFCGNGSDEVLALCFPTFFNPADKKVVFADVTYSFYQVFCNMFNINYSEIPLDEKFEIVEENYLNLPSDVKGIIIANPNAPTGIAISPQKIENIVKTNLDKIIIIDEAYVDFYGLSSTYLTKIYDNVLIVKTFSKGYSLAGLRCGYCVGNENLIEGLNKIKNSFNSYPLDALAQELAFMSITDRGYHSETTRDIIGLREELKVELYDLGFYVLPSRSNFLFVRHVKMAGKELYEKLRDEGILVRHFDKPRISNFLRISIGNRLEQLKLIEVLKKIL